MPTNKWLVQFEVTDTVSDDADYENYSQAEIREIIENGNLHDLSIGMDIGPITVTKQEDPSNAQTN